MYRITFKHRNHEKKYRRVHPGVLEAGEHDAETGSYLVSEEPPTDRMGATAIVEEISS